MSKEGSQVAFIPDNISNISSGKEKFNEDTSQKIQDSYISKFTKFPNNNIESQTVVEQAQIKASTHQNVDSKQEFDRKELVALIKDKIDSISMQGNYAIDNNQKLLNRKSIINKYTKEPVQSNTNTVQFKRYQIFESDNTYLLGKHTQTDVISQKQSFVEEEQDNYIDQAHSKPSVNDFMINHAKNSQKMLKEKDYQSLQEYTEQQREQFYITEVNKYDELQTQNGWLQHCFAGNHKYLLRQTNLLLDYNKAVLMEIQKVQLRTKIIQLELQTNKLKIALRKSQSTKHINFSVDFKLNRPAIVKVPKKIDKDLRTYCCQLQKTVNQLRDQYDSNQKQLSLLQFYHKQFEKKVNFAYIYQEYLIQKAKRQLDKTQNLILSNKNKNPSKNKNSQFKISQNLQKSQQKKFEKVVLTSKQSLSDIDQSITSLANKLKSRKEQIDSKHFIKTNLKSHDHLHMSPQTKNYKSFTNFMRFQEKHIHPQQLNKTGLKSNNDLSLTKRVALTHHKEITQPLNRKFVELAPGQQNASLIPLFNTPNRTKKHFYYQCQMYLKELEKDYLFACQSQKQNILLKNQNGFRQRQLLRMKALQVKNQILDTEVDIVSKQKDLKKQNSILKKQLQLLENQLLAKYGDSNQSSKKVKFSHSVKSPHNIKNILSDEYNLLYKQAEHRLKTFKSAAILQNIAKPNIPKSPKKVQSQRTLQTLHTERGKLTPKQNKLQDSDIKTSKKEDKKFSKSPQHKLKKSLSRSSKFLNRFKTTFSENELNLTINKDEMKKSKTHVNPQKTMFNLTPHRDQIALSPQTESVSEEYYAI